MSNYNKEKVKNYAGLVVPFSCCPIGEAVNQCPFKKYWNEKSFEKKLQAISDLPEQELGSLQFFHRKCLKIKIGLSQANPSNKKYSKFNLGSMMDV